jgi:hypothetical protein
MRTNPGIEKYDSIQTSTTEFAFTNASKFLKDIFEKRINSVINLIILLCFICFGIIIIKVILCFLPKKKINTVKRFDIDLKLDLKWTKFFFTLFLFYFNSQWNLSVILYL